jgi:hypothetical protein
MYFGLRSRTICRISACHADSVYVSSVILPVELGYFASKGPAVKEIFNFAWRRLRMVRDQVIFPEMEGALDREIFVSVELGDYP